MENRRGSGIFLGVVGVATLVVAIIGATFAYFSASAVGDNEVEVTAYEFDADIKVTPLHAASATKLIPLNPTGTVVGATGDHTENLEYTLNATDKCKDYRGYLTCAFYEIEIINNGTTAIEVNGTLQNLENNGFVNLMYQGVTSETTGYELAGSATALLDEENDDGITTLTGGAITVQPGEENSEKVYAVVYLNDTNDTEGENEQDAEMGASYTGQFVFTDASGGGSKLTGTFTVAGE